METEIIIEKLKNHFHDIISVNSRLTFDELQKLCLENFKWLPELPSNNTADILLIRPKLLCLKPFSIIYTNDDDFFHSIDTAKKLVMYITSEIYLIDSLTDIFCAVTNVYDKEIRVGVKSFALSGELLIQKPIEKKVIYEKIPKVNSTRKVHQLI